jgi:hypothetical protein
MFSIGRHTADVAEPLRPLGVVAIVGRRHPQDIATRTSAD